MAAYQDMASLLAPARASADRWSGFVEQAGIGSVQDANLPFVDSTLATGSIAGGGIHVPGIGQVGVAAARAILSDIPDEQRVNRDDKAGRLLKVAPVAPPAKFNAGSVVERTSSLLRPKNAADITMAFAPPAIHGEEIQIATAFHMPRDERQIPGISAIVASLVNNTEPDILASAYAPAEPDFARASPFDSVLRDRESRAGRFVPPVGKGDHAWLNRPLPASAFSDSEQQCLTAGVYFEARGEPVRGQAAVAQVILNRVRNPTYPNTICGVVYQNKNWRNRCQFSFACDGTRPRVASQRHWEIAREVAGAVTAGLIWLPEVGSSTHYHADYVKPRWARSMNRVKTIGRHIFYRTRGGGWS